MRYESIGRHSRCVDPFKEFKTARANVQEVRLEPRLRSTVASATWRRALTLRFVTLVVRSFSGVVQCTIDFSGPVLHARTDRDVYVSDPWHTASNVIWWCFSVGVLARRGVWRSAQVFGRINKATGNMK